MLVRGDGVDGGEGEAEEAVGFILSELGGDGFGEFDGLTRDSCTAYVDGVGVDVTASGAPVTVADRPCFAGELFGGGRIGGVVDVVVGLFVCGEFGGEDPARSTLAMEGVKVCWYERVRTGQKNQYQSPSSRSDRQ